MRQTILKFEEDGREYEVFTDHLRAYDWFELLMTDGKHTICVFLDKTIDCLKEMREDEGGLS